MRFALLRPTTGGLRTPLPEMECAEDSEVDVLVRGFELHKEYVPSLIPTHQVRTNSAFFFELVSRVQQWPRYLSGAEMKQLRGRKVNFSIL